MSHALNNEDAVSQYRINMYLERYMDVHALFCVKLNMMHTVTQKHDACIYKCLKGMLNCLQSYKTLLQNVV